MANEPLPRPPREPIVRVKGMSLMPQSPTAQNWIAMATLVSALLGGAGLRGLFAQSASGKDVQALQAELAEARKELAESKLGELSRKIDRTNERLDLWQADRDEDSARDTLQSEQLRYHAELLCALNLGPSGAKMPCTWNWTKPNDRVPQFTGNAYPSN